MLGFVGGAVTVRRRGGAVPEKVFSSGDASAAAVSPRRRHARVGKSRKTSWRQLRMQTEGEKMATQEDGENLVMAAMMNDSYTVRRFMENGVSPDYASVKNNSGMTALMWAASEGNIELTQLLLDWKVDVNQANSNGFKAIVYAFENMPTARPAPPPPAGFPGVEGKETPKQADVQQRRETGHMGVAKLLIVSGADWRAVNPVTKDTLLHIAARRGHIGLVDLLIDAGLPIDTTNKGYLHTPLHEAAVNGQGAIVRLLVSRNANVNAENRVGWTPLLWAAARGDAEIVQALCESGANVHVMGEAAGAAGKRTTNALTEARRSGNSGAVTRILQKHGAR